MSPFKTNIAIAGFGNIGSYFYKNLEKNLKNVSIKTGSLPYVKYISAKNFKKRRNIKIPKSKWVKNAIDLAFKEDVDIIVELIGGSEGIAKKLVFSALKNKKHVITANKALMAKYGNELAQLAESNNVNLEYEASVAGGIPIIRSIKEGLIGNKINKIYGILNGTTNYILSSMEIKNKSFSYQIEIFVRLFHTKKIKMKIIPTILNDRKKGSKAFRFKNAVQVVMAIVRIFFTSLIIRSLKLFN